MIEELKTLRAALERIREENADFEETWMSGSSAEVSHRKAVEALAALGQLEAVTSKLHAALMRVADGEGVIPHDGCHCQDIAAQALDGVKFEAPLVLSTPVYAGRLTLKGD
jgi:hypothetical protein